MRSLLLAGLCLFGASLAHAAPAAPVVTAGASNIKELQFDWDAVPQTNYYELWFKANAGAQWVKYAETPAQRPRFRIGVSVHLLDWRAARYRVKACNPSGCGTSSDVSVDGEQLGAIGFFKPNAFDGRRFFGGNVAVSADGRTVAAITTEDSDGYQGSAAIYVYRKLATGWVREARLLTNAVQWSTAHLLGGDHVMLSGDGNLLVFGSEAEDALGSTSQNNVGGVYLFRRSGSTWQLAQKLSGENRPFDNFGYEVKVDDAGRTVAVLHRWNGGVFGFGNVEIFRAPHGASSLFVHAASLPVPVVAGEDSFCGAIALSGDGNTLVRGCSQPSDSFVQVLAGPGFSESARLRPGGSFDGLDISYDGTQFLIQDQENAFSYRLGSSGWVNDGYLSNLGNPGNVSRRHIALSRDGKIAALGIWAEKSAGLGPVYPPYQPAVVASGGVAIYERKASGWVFRRLVKPDSTTEAWAGHSVALGDNGRVLVMGAPYDASAATGINGERADDSAAQRGAVWVY